ncbi:hypothetical protein V3W47_12210 [Deinococcus sp. YIM 134068]|uniref:hypothetical protein n=1 Tax=Deinococcus lichenicola TaxID=3118910 RepID=UPI002F957A8E
MEQGRSRRPAHGRPAHERLAAALLLWSAATAPVSAQTTTPLPSPPAQGASNPGSTAGPERSKNTPPVPQTTREATPPLSLTPNADGTAALLSNASAFPLQVVIRGRSPGGEVRRLDVTPGARCEGDGTASTGTEAPLGSGDTLCLRPGAVRTGDQTVRVEVTTRELGGWREVLTLDGQPPPLSLPAAPVAVTHTVRRAAAVACPEGAPLAVALFSADGETATGCFSRAGGFRGFREARVGPGEYRGGAFPVGGEARAATVNVRRHWGLALGLIAAGLLLPALLKFLVDRHREKKALGLAIREQGMSLRQPPALAVPSPLAVPPAPAVVFRLDVDRRALRRGLDISPAQPFSELQDRWRALDAWRALLPPEDVYGRLSRSVATLNGQIGPFSGYVPAWPVQPAGTQARVLGFLQQTVAGRGLGVDSRRVPVSRAEDVVASLRAALRLARTVERLGLPRLSALIPTLSPVPRAGATAARRVLERLLFEVAPGGGSAGEIDAYTARVVALGDGLIAALVGGSPGLTPAGLGAGDDPPAAARRSGPLGRAQERANLEVRFFTLPLLAFTLVVACIVGLRALYFENATWGRVPLDYAWALAGGTGGFAAAALIEGVFRRQLSGSALVPGLLRRPRSGGQTA